MRDVMAELERWWQSGAPVGMATVVRTWKSAPRQPGASMLVGPDDTAVGSVSGGCVEGAVYELATTARDDGQPRLQRYGVSDDDAFAVGLTCGGIIEVFVERVDPLAFPQLGQVAYDIRAGRPVAVATVIDTSPASPATLGARMLVRPNRSEATLGSERLDDAVRDDAQGLLAQATTTVLRYGPDGERRRDDIAVFVASYAPKPRMIVFGASG